MSGDTSGGTSGGTDEGRVCGPWSDLAGAVGLLLFVTVAFFAALAGVLVVATWG